MSPGRHSKPSFAAQTFASQTLLKTTLTMRKLREYHAI